MWISADFSWSSVYSDLAIRVRQMQTKIFCNSVSIISKFGGSWSLAPVHTGSSCLFLIPWRYNHVSSPVITSHDHFEPQCSTILCNYFKHRTLCFFSSVSRSGIHFANILELNYVGFSPLFPWIDHTLNILLTQRSTDFLQLLCLLQDKSVHFKQLLDDGTFCVSFQTTEMVNPSTTKQCETQDAVHEFGQDCLRVWDFWKCRNESVVFLNPFCF